MVTKINALLVVAILLLNSQDSEAQQQANVEHYLYNHPWMRETIQCLLDRGPCDDIRTTMKGMAGWLIKTRCSSCSPEMKHNYERVASFLESNYRREWRELNIKYGQ